MYKTSFYWCDLCQNGSYDRILSKEIDNLNNTNRTLMKMLLAAGVVIFFQHKRIKSLKTKVSELENKMKEKSEDEK